MQKKYVIIIILIFLIVLFIIIKTAVLEKRNIAAVLSSLGHTSTDILRNTTMIKNSTLHPKIKVNFWSINPETLEKADHLGSATIIDSKLIVDIKDPILKKILDNPYTPVAEISEEGTAKDWQISYQPGSIAHLKAIAREAWRWGYVAETQEFLKK